METAAAAGQPDPEAYCTQLLFVPEQAQAEIEPGPDDLDQLPGPEMMTPPEEPEEEEEDMMMASMSFDSLTFVLDDVVKVSIDRKHHYETETFKSTFTSSQYAKHPLRIAVKDIKKNEVVVLDGYCGTVLDIAQTWATGDYEVLSAAFDGKRTVRFDAINDFVADFTQGNYIMGSLASGVGGMARAVGQRGMNAVKGSANAGGQQGMVNSARDALAFMQRMGVQATDQVMVAVRAGSAGVQQLKGVAQQVAMQIQQLAARTGGVMIERVQKTSAGLRTSTPPRQGTSPSPGISENTGYSEEENKMLKKLEQEVIDLRARLAQSEYMEKVTGLSVVPGTPEQLAGQLVKLGQTSGDDAVREQLRSWQAEQYNAEASSLGESLLEAGPGLLGGSFEEHIQLYMKDNPETTRRQAFMAVGKEHPDLRKGE